MLRLSLTKKAAIFKIAGTVGGKPHKCWLPAVFRSLELNVFFAVIDSIYTTVSVTHTLSLINT